jgi:hypothetical protein
MSHQLKSNAKRIFDYIETEMAKNAVDLSDLNIESSDALKIAKHRVMDTSLEALNQTRAEIDNLETQKEVYDPTLRTNAIVNGISAAAAWSGTALAVGLAASSSPVFAEQIASVSPLASIAAVTLSTPLVAIMGKMIEQFRNEVDKEISIEEHNEAIEDELLTLHQLESSLEGIHQQSLGLTNPARKEVEVEDVMDSLTSLSLEENTQEESSMYEIPLEKLKQFEDAEFDEDVSFRHS